MMRFLFFTYFLVLSLKEVKSQNRLQDNNSIGWLAMFNTIKWSSKWSSHLEFQYRRADFVKHAQQNLYRFGINYDALPNAQIRFGFATVTTFPYGDYPINTFGKIFGENRLYEMITFQQKLSSLQLTHRLMLEQRWTKKFSSKELEKPDLTSYTNRFRYMFRAQLPIGFKKEKKSYFAAFDELFLSFGKNVGENIFDQNRTGLLFGRTLSNSVRLEGGYFCQIVQLSREVDNKNVIQYNQGFIVNSHFTFNRNTHHK
jgi:hypothetical protein